MNTLEISVGWYQQSKYLKCEIRSTYIINQVKIKKLGFLTIRVTK